jgi:hypothetical protein
MKTMIKNLGTEVTFEYDGTTFWISIWISVSEWGKRKQEGTRVRITRAQAARLADALDAAIKNHDETH